MFLGVVKKAKKATVAIISFDRSVSSSRYLFVWFLRSLLVFYCTSSSRVASRGLAGVRLQKKKNNKRTNNGCCEE